MPETDVERSRAARHIKAEANLLRLPLFALGTKGLKTLDGIECRGRINRDGQAREFTFRVTRNTGTLYPGPLARAAHLAFLSILSEQPALGREPLTWTWRDLCRRMGIVYGGQMVRHLKEAVTATAGLLLRSEFALYSKPHGKLLHTQQDALHLYDRIVFTGSPLPDGGVADRNQLWLSDWYRDNLNAMFTAPLDYTLWRHLDQRSPIASRLYEFLLINFHSGAPVLHINYQTLARFLPVRTEKYRSDAQNQLGTALGLLRDVQVLQKADWAESKLGLAQLHLYRGDRLAPTVSMRGSACGDAVKDFQDSVEVKELRNLQPSAEWGLVTEFYRLWTGETQRRPTAKELTKAKELIARHGPVKAKGIIEPAVRRLKAEWPTAKTFGAVGVYLADAVRDYDRSQARREQEVQERKQEVEDRVEQTRKREQYEQAAAVWETMAETKKEGVRAAVRAKFPHVAKNPEVFERFCLGHLVRQQTNVAQTK